MACRRNIALETTRSTSNNSHAERYTVAQNKQWGTKPERDEPMRTAVRVVAMENLLREYRHADANVLEGAGGCVNDRSGDMRCDTCRGYDEMFGGTERSSLIRAVREYWQGYRV